MKDATLAAYLAFGGRIVTMKSVARHYGFTEEELDFLLNYDLKYRLGRDTEAEDE